MPTPTAPWTPHSQLSKGLKSWVITLLHLSPSRHITLMLTMSAAVSFWDCKARGADVLLEQLAWGGGEGGHRDEGVGGGRRGDQDGNAGGAPPHAHTVYGRGRQTSSVQGQVVSTLGLMGPTVSVITTQLSYTTCKRMGVAMCQ